MNGLPMNETPMAGLLGDLDRPHATIRVTTAQLPKNLDVPAYVVEVFAAPAGQEIEIRVLHLETVFSPLVFQLTGWIFDTLRASATPFDVENETPLEL